eukprot:6477881-Amphidinium_carterae.2
MFASVPAKLWARERLCDESASMRRSSPLELMSYGGPAGDPQVTADFNTIRIWQQRLDAGMPEWSLEERVWTTALDKGRGIGPIRHLRLLADRLGWIPQPGGWKFAFKRPDFAGLETGLSTQTFGHLKTSTAKLDDRSRSAVNAGLGGVWHEAHTHSAFAVSYLCVRRRKEVEDLFRIVFCCDLGVKPGAGAGVPAQRSACSAGGSSNVLGPKSSNGALEEADA